jgi:acetyl-CoA synthetase
MTRGFWQDPERYESAYWGRFPDVWVHGDWAVIDDEGFWYILGRSDDTIKVAGKRLGPAEVESAAVAHPAVAEAAAVGVPHPVKGEAITVFCVLRPDVEPSDEIREGVRAAVTKALGPALRPEAVLFVAALPKTRNGKVLRRLIRARHLGSANLGDTSSLESQEALEAIAQAR